MAAEKGIKTVEKATIYDIRRLLKNAGKKTYELEELLDLLDAIADSKDQES